jgi:hypothetical protein
LCIAAAPPAQSTKLVPGLDKVANASLDLATSEVFLLDLAPGGYQSINVPLGGVMHQVHLEPHSVRSPDYRLLVQVEDGSIEERVPGPVNTVRGTVEGVPGSLVSGGMLDDGLVATILFQDGTRYWIEPLGNRIADAPVGLHVSYDNEDVLDHVLACGNEVGHDRKALDVDVDHHDHATEEESGAGSLAGGTIYCTEIACDADVNYFNDYGSVSAVENRINLVINTVNLQYESQCSIQHVLTAVVVRTSEPDPYTSNDSDTLLCQFITEWTNNQQGLAFDVAKLFTGRSISGGIIGQAANFGEICDRLGSCGSFLDDGGFCYSESDCCGSFACTTDLCSHELGHLWDAVHCSCPNNTMNSFIGSCNNSFTNGTINDIVSHRNSRSCLEQNCEDDPVDICADITSFSVRCNDNGRIRGNVQFGDNSHDGETVVWEIDGTPYNTTVVNARAKLSIAGFGGSGSHTVTVPECNLSDVVDCGGGGGGGEFCDDVTNFTVQCNSNGRIRGNVRFADNSHNGETVTWEIDGTSYNTTVVNDRAKLSVGGFNGTGSHTVGIPECGLSDTVNCN